MLRVPEVFEAKEKWRKYEPVPWPTDKSNCTSTVENAIAAQRQFRKEEALGAMVEVEEGSHVRASSVPSLYAGYSNKCSCNFLFVARVGLCCGFCDFAVSFLVPPDGPKNGT